MQAALVVIDEDAGGDVHGIDQAQSLTHAALAESRFDLGSDVHQLPPLGQFEPQFFAERFHRNALGCLRGTPKCNRPIYSSPVH